MASTNPNDQLVEIPIEMFRSATRDIGFDVFLRLSEENVAHVFSKSTGLDYKRLAGYMLKGVKSLLIRKEDLPAYEAFVAKPAQAIFDDPSTSPERRIATLLNMTEQNMAEIFSQVSVRDETAEDTQRLLRSYVDLMTENPQSLAVILKLVSHGEYLYYHSIAVSIFSLFIAKATGQFDAKLLEAIGLGAFLHDIGCTQLPRELVECPNEYDDAQWDEMKTHVKLGLAMLNGNARITDEVRFIVYQHHEEPSGQGYPNRLQGARIFYPAKVVALADAFSAMISKKPYRQALAPEEAIAQLQDGGRHDHALVNILASIILRPDSKTAA